MSEAMRETRNRVTNEADAPVQTPAVAAGGPGRFDDYTISLMATPAQRAGLDASILQLRSAVAA